MSGRSPWRRSNRRWRCCEPKPHWAQALFGGPACAPASIALAGLAAASPNSYQSRQVGVGEFNLATALPVLLGLTDAAAVLEVGAHLALAAHLPLRIRRGVGEGPNPVAFAPLPPGGFAKPGITWI